MKWAMHSVITVIVIIIIATTTIIITIIVVVVIIITVVVIITIIIIIIIIIILIQIIIIPFKGAIQDFLQFPCCAANRLQCICVQIRGNTWSTYLLQHVLLQATRVRRDSSAIKFDRVEVAFILALSYLAEPLNG